jgi:hypothetical protein
LLLRGAGYEGVLPRRGADDLAILHLPKLRVSIPAVEVLAVEQRLEAVGGEGLNEHE